MNTFPIICPSNVCNILHRAPRIVRPHGSRTIHLLHHLFNKEPKSLYELASIVKAKYPPADQLSLTLLNGPGNKPSTMTLSEALNNLQPCLYLTQTEEASEARPGVYRIKRFKPPDVLKKSRKVGPDSTKYYKRDGRGKECYFTTDCTASYLSHQLSLAYNFLLEGSRMEFHLRQRSKNKRQTVDWALSHRFDLRPESILAAMPPGTTMLALPGVHGPSPEGRRPKNRIKIDEVFWALENTDALEITKGRTPKKIKELGTWSRKISIPPPGDRIDDDADLPWPQGKPPWRRVERGYCADSPEFRRRRLQGDLADLLEPPPNDSDPEISPKEMSPQEEGKISYIRPSPEMARRWQVNPK